MNADLSARLPAAAATGAAMMCPHGEPIACSRCGDDEVATMERILRAYRMYDRFRDYNSLFALLDACKDADRVRTH